MALLNLATMNIFTFAAKCYYVNNEKMVCKPF